MSIHPTDPGRIGKSTVGRLRKLPTPSSAERPRSPSPSSEKGLKPDQVEISERARQLLEAQESGGGEPGGLSAEQLRSVLDRIADGHYDRPEIRDQTILRLLPHLNEDGTTQNGT